MLTSPWRKRGIRSSWSKRVSARSAQHLRVPVMISVMVFTMNWIVSFRLSLLMRRRKSAAYLGPSCQGQRGQPERTNQARGHDQIDRDRCPTCSTYSSKDMVHRVLGPREGGDERNLLGLEQPGALVALSVSGSTRRATYLPRDRLGAELECALVEVAIRDAHRGRSGQ